MVVVAFAVGTVAALATTGISPALASMPVMKPIRLHVRASDPARSIAPSPDFTQVCTASPVDDSARCLETTLAAIDRARSAEGLGPLHLPAGFASLPVPKQTFAVLNAERLSRGLAPFVQMSPILDASSRQGALSDSDPTAPRGPFVSSNGEWAGGVANGLIADYFFLYDDGPGGPNPDCVAPGDPACWAHRNGILETYGSGQLEMGASFVTDDIGDSGGSLAVTIALREGAGS